MSSTAVKSALYNEVRSGFVRSGTTLNSWCAKQGLTRQYVEKCLKFQRNGPKAFAMRQVTAAAAGVDETSAAVEAGVSAA